VATRSAIRAARQAEVALLLARRKTTPEIAEILCISPRTARHHTEAVMAKLNVRTRLEVAPVIGRAAPTL
jgi:DNA-binding CsgD family transcriptional regulator